MLFFTIKDPGLTLGEQIEFAEYVEANSNQDQRLLFVAIPDIIFLSNRRNFNRYILYPVDILYLEKTGELVPEGSKKVAPRAKTCFHPGGNPGSVHCCIDLFRHQETQGPAVPGE